jgi:TorA maturation chaperone TorD
MTEGISEATQVGRTILYRFLALGFHEPGQALFALLGDVEEHSQLRAAAEELDATGETDAVSAALLPLLEALPPAGLVLRDLRVEYTRLFIGPGQTPCPPSESVFDLSRPEEDRGTVLGPSAEAMKWALAEEGLVIDLGHNELPDHIAIELEYMLYLLGKALGSETLDTDALERANLFL